MAVVYVLMCFKCKICFTVYTGETILTYLLALYPRSRVNYGQFTQWSNVTNRPIITLISSNKYIMRIDYAVRCVGVICSHLRAAK